VVYLNSIFEAIERIMPHNLSLGKANYIGCFSNINVCCHRYTGLLAEENGSKIQREKICNMQVRTQKALFTLFQG
jgi:hypothetical protein